jgi:hypothetical protein
MAVYGYIHNEIRSEYDEKWFWEFRGKSNSYLPRDQISSL